MAEFFPTVFFSQTEDKYLICIYIYLKKKKLDTDVILNNFAYLFPPPPLLMSICVLIILSCKKSARANDDQI